MTAPDNSDQDGPDRENSSESLPPGVPEPPDLAKVRDLRQRIVATTRIARHIDITPANFATGDEADLTVYGKTPMGYKAIVNNTHTGLIFANEVFQELALGEKLKGWIAGVRADEKIDSTLEVAFLGEHEAHLVVEVPRRPGEIRLLRHTALPERFGGQLRELF